MYLNNEQFSKYIKWCYRANGKQGMTKMLPNQEFSFMAPDLKNPRHSTVNMQSYLDY